MGSTLAISGASGKTGYRVAEEALARDLNVRLLIQPASQLPASLQDCDVRRPDFGDPRAVTKALEGCAALVIATGARPSADLLGPLKVDAWGVQRQVRACQMAGVKRLVLVSSLCSGRLLHPLNLFGLILLCKRMGEQALERSGLEWTIVRPGGLREDETDLDLQGLVVTGRNTQESRSIPRRLVARCCLDALEIASSVGRVLEITSNRETPVRPLADAIAAMA